VSVNLTDGGAIAAREPPSASAAEKAATRLSSKLRTIESSRAGGDYNVTDRLIADGESTHSPTGEVSPSVVSHLFNQVRCKLQQFAAQKPPLDCENVGSDDQRLSKRPQSVEGTILPSTSAIWAI
jgi:hypothetical protein